MSNMGGKPSNGNKDDNNNTNDNDNTNANDNQNGHNDAKINDVSNDQKNDQNDPATNNNVSLGSMTIQTPFWSRIAKSKRILLSGCGGGFDIYQGIPLFFTLQSMGKEVFFANYAFSSPEYEKSLEMWYAPKDKNETYPLVVVVDASTVPLSSIKRTSYFPEYYLSQYFNEKLNLRVPVYTFPHYGYTSLCAAYEILVDKLNIDTVITIDGGTDSLMKGNEYGVGTVEEDYNSIFAVNNIKNKNVIQKYLICLGMGVDRYHGVSDVSTLRSISELTQSKSYLGCIQLLPWQQPSIYYREASEFAYKSMAKNSISIVGSSILTSISGQFGNKHWPGNDRTKGSKLFINPLMSMYWIFTIKGVYDRIDNNFKKEWKKNCATQFSQVRTAVSAARAKIQKNGNMLKAHENYPATDDLLDKPST